ncbi:hypothetical protein LDENG_00036750 [Lucifuga dentata]|nr:hypothetical protein LDENG_00036750 [Lucifuga dentata]
MVNVQARMGTLPSFTKCSGIRCLLYSLICLTNHFKSSPSNTGSSLNISSFKERTLYLVPHIIL